MKRQRKMGFLRFINSIAGLLLCLSLAGQSDGIMIDNIIAKVDDKIILRSDLEKAYLDFLSRGEFRAANAKCQILEQLIVNKMLVAKAAIDSVIIEDAEVRSNLSRRMEYMIAQVGSAEEIEKFYKKPMSQIEEELFESIKEQMTIQRMQGEITTDMKVSPSEVKKFFAKIPQDSLPYFSTEVEVAQIVIIPKPGRDQKEWVKRQMYEIKGRIISGESFGELAREYSEDPGSAARGGQLPFYKRGDLAPEFEATAMTLNPGELSDPVETDFGFHLIELQEKRGNTFQSRHILISPKPSQADIKRAETYLDSLRTAILLDSITFDAAAKEYSDDKETSPSGGFFLDENGAARISVEQLDPTIFFTLDTMQIGRISKPERFQMPDGTSAFRILYFKSKVPPHQANLKDDYQKIAGAALDNKRNRVLSKWFDEARNDVFIEVDPEFNYCDLLED